MVRVAKGLVVAAVAGAIALGATAANASNGVAIKPNIARSNGVAIKPNVDHSNGVAIKPNVARSNGVAIKPNLD